MEQGPNMSKVKEPKAIAGVLIFSIIFIVGFGIWYGPLLEFASKAVPQFGSIGPVVPGVSSSFHLVKPAPVTLSNSSRAGVAPVAVLVPFNAHKL
jgi:hypothetical protein